MLKSIPDDQQGRGSDGHGIRPREFATVYGMHDVRDGDWLRVQGDTPQTAIAVQQLFESPAVF